MKPWEGAEAIINLTQKLSGGRIEQAIKMIQWALYSLKVQENPDLPPPDEWH